MDKRLERILPRVQKPARYVGGEYNAVLKDKTQVDTRIAFCFPDTYEIGMSNLGMRILYGVMNEMDGVWCERVFAPWGDMEEEMRKAAMPLFALESGDPITDFDIVAFSVGYEMAFPAILNMLDLAGIPLHAAERTGLSPLVIAGGTAMYNAEPIADFIDLVSLGEGEDITVELVELHRKAASRRRPAGRRLRSQPLRCHIPRGRHRGRHHPEGRRTGQGDKAHRPRHGQVLFPRQDHRPQHGDRAGPRDAGAVPRLYPGLPVLSGGLRLPPCPQPQPRPVRRLLRPHL